MIYNQHLPDEQASSVGGPKPATAEALLRSTAQWRTSFYIDGFNLYHAIDGLHDNRLKWVDINSLCRSFLTKDDTLSEIHFFTALNRWDRAKRQRHVAFKTAIERTGVRVHLGTFDRPNKFCWERDEYCRNYHEKKTDVSIAVTLICDGFEDKYDKVFLISADSYQVPLAERFAVSLRHKRLFHIAPPGRFSEARELAKQIGGKSFHLTADRISQHLLPREVRGPAGNLIVARPAKYEQQ